MQAIKTTIGLAAALLLLSSTRLCAASSLSAHDVAGDKRLSKPVTIHVERICIGELVERLARQTHVKVEADDKDAGSGIEVTVQWDNIPLGDALNAIWALVSYQKAEWDWDWHGKPAVRTYKLYRTPAAKELAVRTKQSIQDTFETEAKQLMALLHSSPEDRKKLLGQDKDDLIRSFAADERTMSGIRIFAESLTPEQQQAVLGGQQHIHIPFTALSPEGQTYVLRETKQYNSDNSVPEEVVFSTEPNLKGAGLAVPTMFMFIGNTGGYGYFGGGPLERILLRRQAAEWILPGDQPKNPQDKSICAAANKADQPIPDGKVIETRLQQLAEAAHLNVIARLPRGGKIKDPGAPGHKQVALYLRLLLDNLPQMQSKWRDNLLLLTYPHWFDEAEPPSYAVIGKMNAH